MRLRTSFHTCIFIILFSQKCIRMHACVCSMCVSVCVRACACVCVPLCQCAGLACMCTHACVHTYECLCGCVCVRVRVYVCARVNAHIHICGNISVTRCFQFSSSKHIVSINTLVFDFIAFVRDTMLKKAIFYVTLSFSSVYIHTFGHCAA